MSQSQSKVLLNGPIKRSEVELMAPAGNFESLQAAIQGGADSVYFGIGRLNMRSKSSINFTIDDLPEIVRRCKESNTLTYLTVNTIIYDSDIDEMKQIVDAAKNMEFQQSLLQILQHFNMHRHKGLKYTLLHK